MFASNFVQELEQFALASDNIDEAASADFKKALGEFLENQGISYFEVSTDGELVNNRPGLRSVWTNGKEVSWEIESEEGFASFAYGKKARLWVTAEDGLPLSRVESDQYVEGWSNLKGLPKFWNYTGDLETGTSIHLPLVTNHKSSGLFVLEAQGSHPPTEIAKKNLILMASSLGTILAAYQLGKSQRENTKAAIANLFQSARDRTPWLLKRPSLFFAFSNNGDQRLIGLVKEVLNEYDEYFEVVFWDSMATTGNIHSQVFQEIRRANYGICYFSEATKKGDYAYRDNLNVVFEAGMFHAANPELGASRWIPIREENSPKAPFDYNAERAICVDSERDGNNPQKVKSKLKEYLDSWIR